MSWIRNLLQLFFSHPTMGPQLIQRLSETRPIRAAARATAYVYLRGKQGSMKGLCFVEKSQYAFKALMPFSIYEKYPNSREQLKRALSTFRQ